MVLQVKIPNIYYIDDHHPDSETGWMKWKIKYGGEDTGGKKTKTSNNSFSHIIKGSAL